MHLPTPQGSDCATFAQPPLDGSLTIPEIYERQAANSPNHPLFVFPEAPGQLRTICYAEVVQAIHNAAHIVESAYMRCKDRYILQKQMHNLDPTFGILAAAGDKAQSYLRRPAHKRNTFRHDKLHMLDYGCDESWIYSIPNFNP